MKPSANQNQITSVLDVIEKADDKRISVSVARVMLGAFKTQAVAKGWEVETTDSDVEGFVTVIVRKP